MSLGERLTGLEIVHVRQRRELAELFGLETRNKYEVQTSEGEPIGYAAEQQKGLFGFFFRQALGHWRTFELSIFDVQRRLAARAVHPFRFFLQRLEVYAPDGRPLGAIQQRFALLSKRFDVLDASGGVVMRVRSPLWRPWTFPFLRGEAEVARVEKRWAGLLAEAFTDKDVFRVSYADRGLDAGERLVLLAAAIFVDLQYFEAKAD